MALIGNAILPCYAANPPFEFTRQCQFSDGVFPPRCMNRTSVCGPALALPLRSQ